MGMAKIEHPTSCPCMHEENPARSRQQEGMEISKFGHVLFHSHRFTNRWKEYTGLRPRRISIEWERLAMAAGLNLGHLYANRNFSELHIHKWKTSIHRIRIGISMDPILHLGFTDLQFGVAPKHWPMTVRNAFNLVDPPTPYETATILLKSPFTKSMGGNTVGGTQEAHNFHSCAQATLVAFLSGLHMEVICYLHQQPIHVIHSLMASAIKALMNDVRFALWALATNPLPAIRTPQEAEAYTHFQTFKALGPLRITFKGLIERPWFRMQLKSGEVFERVPRPLGYDDIIWPTVEHKMIAMEAAPRDTKGWRAVSKWHSFLSTSFHTIHNRTRPSARPLPSWSQPLLFDFVSQKLQLSEKTHGKESSSLQSQQYIGPIPSTQTRSY